MVRTGRLELVAGLQANPHLSAGAEKRAKRSAVSAVIARLPARIAVIRLSGTFSPLAAIGGEPAVRQDIGKDLAEVHGRQPLAAGLDDIAEVHPAARASSIGISLPLPQW